MGIYPWMISKPFVYKSSLVKAIVSDIVMTMYTGCCEAI